jgi:putative sterol carrier protein
LPNEDIPFYKFSNKEEDKNEVGIRYIENDDDNIINFINKGEKKIKAVKGTMNDITINHNYSEFIDLLNKLYLKVDLEEKKKFL